LFTTSLVKSHVVSSESLRFFKIVETFAHNSCFSAFGSTTCTGHPRVSATSSSAKGDEEVPTLTNTVLMPLLE
jgi:hypothetical protein